MANALIESEIVPRQPQPKDVRTPRQPKFQYRHRVLTLLFSISVITFLDRVCISVAGPRMQADLGITPERWGWIVGAFALAYGMFEIPGGVLADRVGARKVLTRIVIWWSVFTILTGTASGFYGLLFVRFMFGAGEAGAYPAMSSSASRWFPAMERGRAHGIIWMASRIGGAISPLLVVPIQAAYGWRTSFYVFGVMGFVWAIIWYRWYRDHPCEKPGVTADEMAYIGATAAPTAHLAMPWSKVLKNRQFWIILFMYHTYCWGAYFYLSWLHTYLERGRGFSESEMQIFSVLPFALGACANLFGGTLSDRLCKRYGLKIGRRTVGATGLACSGVFLLATALTGDKYIAVACLTLGYGSMDCMLPVAWATCLDIAKSYAGAVTGAMNMAGQIGSFLSSVAFGYMVVSFGNYNQPLIPLAVMLFISALLFLRIDPTKQLVVDEIVST